MASLEMVLTAAGALIEEYSVCVCAFFNFCNPVCQMCLMQVINLIGWITVPFLMPPFAMSLTLPFIHFLLICLSIHTVLQLLSVYLLTECVELGSGGSYSQAPMFLKVKSN